MIPKGFIFWLLMILWFIFGLWSAWPIGSFVPVGANLLLFVLLAILGWAVFGKPVS